MAGKPTVAAASCPRPNLRPPNLRNRHRNQGHFWLREIGSGNGHAQAAHQEGTDIKPPARGREARRSARLPGERRLRSDASASAVRVPVAEAAIFAVHAGSGGANHGHSERSIAEGVRPLHVHPQRRRHEEGGDDHLRGGLDAAHVRHTDHPHGGDDSIAARKRGASGRRSECVARPFEHSGRDGYGGHFRYFARLFENAEPERHGPGGLPEAHHADVVKTRRVGFVQLLVEHAEIRRSRCSKSFYGDAATKQNDFAFNYLPKIDRNYSWTQIWDQMYRGNVKGMFAFGMNGVMVGPDTQKNIDALKKADWLVVGEIYPDETSEFWRAPGTTADEMKKINTTVYRLPCAGFAEKDGSMTNSARWLQWKNAAVPPPGDARLDQDILAQIFLRVRGALPKRRRKIPRSGPACYVGIYRSAASVAGRGDERDQRQGARRPEGRKNAAGNQDGTAIARFCLVEGRRNNGMRNWIYSGRCTEAAAI